eukprot:CAMPEP_0115123988 /NCGR_PEP_ID=MMETSP0227-20121206/47973_1 /TAXON_ID=89957 /ORGANISM="Polarella glacialis, Strain CCMP 1383" /LENGTH=129 /DNA_ID=CAMNT_0002526671 /DNA_START=409 /DNA_END=793 /DNA_ORIENTATION=-
MLQLEVGKPQVRRPPSAALSSSTQTCEAQATKAASSDYKAAEKTHLPIRSPRAAVPLDCKAATNRTSEEVQAIDSSWQARPWDSDSGGLWCRDHVEVQNGPGRMKLGARRSRKARLAVVAVAIVDHSKG